MEGVILAAGRGERLGPVTAVRSKAMVPVLGVPMVERVAEQLQAGGVNDLFLVVDPDDEAIQAHFDGRARLIAQRQRLGMADALRQAVPFLAGNAVVAACDNLVPVDDVKRLIERWERSELDALLALLPVAQQEVAATAVVATEGPWVRRIVEKPSLEEAPSKVASIALYCFSPRLFEQLEAVTPSPRGEYELQDAIQGLIDAGGRVQGLVVSGRRTLTRPTDLLRIVCELLAEEVSDRPTPDEWGPGSRLIPPVYVGPAVTVGADCTVGPMVALEQGAQIGDGATVRDTVMLPGAVVGAKSRVRGEVVTGPAL
jgi:glucose-1-phosphate thymidylyltransferase